MDQKQIIVLIGKNYTGDAEQYEESLLKSLQSAISPVHTDITTTASQEISPKKEDDLPPADAKKLTKEEAEQIKKTERIYKESLAFIKDAIAPSMIKIDTTKLQVGETFARSFFTYSYPDYLEGNWLSPIINWDVKFDMSIFVYPVESDYVMKFLRKRLTELYSERSINAEKGLINDPALEAQIQDVEELRGSLTRGQERYFHFSIYITVYADSEEQLRKLSNTMESLLSGRNILTKPAYLRAEQGFVATGPFAKDEVGVYRNISTKGLSTTFPFTSSSLSQDEGILYGINTHNNSLIIFDRFKMENANMVVFAKSGGGKSFAVKLEILRSLMLGTDVIVIDPENEYKPLVETVGGSYLNINLNSSQRINPFDLPRPLKDDETKPGDLLRGAIVNLIGLMHLILGKCSSSEEALIEKALTTTYSLKGITFQDDDITNKEIPVMRDFYSVLETMDGAKSITERLEKYVYGIFSGIFSEQTNISLGDGLQVFSVRDLDEILRPAAMYILLNYIWNVVRSENRKRLLVIDEAWNMLQHEDTAKFLFGLVKRARKYNLGITTITQDVEDFTNSKHGRAIVTNSSIQLLLKQSTAAINSLKEVFHLTDQEKYILLNSSVGQGLFFVGTEHVGIHILASYFEEKVISTNPNT